MNPMLYMPIPAVIERIEDETPDIKTFTIRPETPMPFKAGQFVELALPGVGEAPFTPSSSPRITENMEITIMRTGRVTDWPVEVAVNAGDDPGRGDVFLTVTGTSAEAGWSVRVDAEDVQLQPLVKKIGKRNL